MDSDSSRLMKLQGCRSKLWILPEVNERSRGYMFFYNECIERRCCVLESERGVMMGLAGLSSSFTHRKPLIVL